MTTILFDLDSLQAQYPVFYFWVDTLFKSSLIILLALLFHWFYRRQSASSHGLIWLIAITSCLCIPVFKLTIPEIGVTVAVQGPGAVNDAGITPAGNLYSPETTAQIKALLFSTLLLVYLVGLFVMLSNLAISIGKLFRISSQASGVVDSRLDNTLRQLMCSNGISAKVTLLFSSYTSTPFTWGVVHHRLILPVTAKEWNQQLLRQAIGHELGHIQRNDWICQLLGRITLCLYWPNPLLWYATRHLRIASEKASDDAAVDCPDSDIGYASNLLHMANCIRSQELTTRVAMGLFSSPSILALRIRHILLTDRNRSLLRADEIITATLMTLLLVAPFSSFEVSARLIEPSAEIKDYIPLTFDARENRAIFNIIDEPTPAAPPQHLLSGRSTTELKSGQKKREVEFEINNKTIAVDQGERFKLATEELFQQWEATPLQIPAPDYPVAALRKGIEGFVVAEFSLDKEGNAISPRIIESVPTGTFDRAVLRAVEKYVYCPEIVDGIGGSNQAIRKRFSFTLQN